MDSILIGCDYVAERATGCHTRSPPRPGSRVVRHDFIMSVWGAEEAIEPVAAVELIACDLLTEATLGLRVRIRDLDSRPDQKIEVLHCQSWSERKTRLANLSEPTVATWQRYSAGTLVTAVL